MKSHLPAEVAEMGRGAHASSRGIFGGPPKSSSCRLPLRYVVSGKVPDTARTMRGSESGYAPTRSRDALPTQSERSS
jgi:hypothetical protein